MIFIDNGLEIISLNEDIEIIEAAENEVDTVSFFNNESSLVKILKKYNDASEIVHIGDKWKGGRLIL